MQHNNDHHYNIEMHQHSCANTIFINKKKLCITLSRAHINEIYVILEKNR
jgi:hypothetical protein